MERPILSIIIPVYNALPYLEACVSSTLKQGFSDEELEVICVDDGSTDGSGEWLDKYSINHKNIIVIHKKNGGVASARNLGMEKMNGYFFEFLDADDEIIPYSIRDIIEAMIKEHCDIAQFCYSRRMINKMEGLSYEVKSMELKGYVWNYIFSSEQFSTIRFDEKLYYSEDTYFTQMVKLCNPMCLFTSRECYYYRENPNSLTTKRDFRKHANSMLRISENLKDYLNKNQFPDQKKRIETWCARATAGYIYFLLRAGEKKNPFPMLQSKGLWPYKKEWNLLRILIGDKERIKEMLSSYCLFFVGFRPIWWIFMKTAILKRVSN